MLSIFFQSMITYNQRQSEEPHNSPRIKIMTKLLLFFILVFILDYTWV